MNGSVGTFVDPPSLLIVGGGTIASTMVAYPLGSVIKTILTYFSLFGNPKVDYVQTYKTLIQAAEAARTGGGVALEKIKVDDDFVKLAFQLVADGYKSPEVQGLLQIETEASFNRSSEYVAILEKMGDMSPAWGMIGTLIGLVLMLVKLDDPAAIGPAMAVALLTTFYGALFANLFFIPGATKLEDRTSMELTKMKLVTEGAAAIARSENPRQVQQRLMSFMPPETRSSLSGAGKKKGKK